MSPEDFDKKLDQLYKAAKSASSEGLKNEALRLCDEALALLESLGEDTDQFGYSDFVMLSGDIFWAAADWEEAFMCYQRVALNDPERADSRVAMGIALYHLCRFQSAQQTLEVCSIEEPDDAEVWYYLGLLALRGKSFDLADVYFEKAADLHEDRYPMPKALPDQEVVELVENFLGQLPSPLAEALHGTPLEFDTHPSEAMLMSADPPMDPTIMILFDGFPVGEQTEVMESTGPEKIIIFRENIHILAGDPVKLNEELTSTIKQEIGHFFGLSEDELSEQGLD